MHLITEELLEANERVLVMYKEFELNQTWMKEDSEQSLLSQ